MFTFSSFDVVVLRRLFRFLGVVVIFILPLCTFFPITIDLISSATSFVSSSDTWFVANGVTCVDDVTNSVEPDFIGSSILFRLRLRLLVLFGFKSESFPKASDLCGISDEDDEAAEDASVNWEASRIEVATMKNELAVVTFVILPRKNDSSSLFRRKVGEPEAD